MTSPCTASYRHLFGDEHQCDALDHPSQSPPWARLVHTAHGERVDPRCVPVGIRVAVQRALRLDRLKALDHYDQVRSPAITHKHVLTVTVGASAFALQQNFEEAIRRAEDALLRAEQAGGNRFLLSSAV
jgi:hypothetical protein